MYHSASLILSELGNVPQQLTVLESSDEEELFIEVLVQATVSKNDLGVPRSPTWYEVDDIEVEEITINENTYTWPEFKKVYSEYVCNAIHEVIAERLTLDDLEEV
jgi:hypothetical protein